MAWLHHGMFVDDASRAARTLINTGLARHLHPRLPGIRQRTGPVFPLGYLADGMTYTAEGD